MEIVIAPIIFILVVSIGIGFFALLDRGKKG